MRRGISIRVLIVSSFVTIGCEEVRVRPEELDPPHGEETESTDQEGALVLGDLSLPTPLAPVAISAGYYNTCAVLGDGRVACFGDNQTAFELGEAPETLTAIEGARGRHGVSVGKRRACAWERGGALLCWPGRYGQRRVIAEGMPEVKGASVGGGHVCGVLVDGHVRCVGADEWSQSQTPFRRRGHWVQGVEGVTRIATGATHTCALHEDRGVTCWGDNRENQMGDGSDRVRALPRRVPGLSDVTEISSHALAVQTCGLIADDSVACWGSHGVARAGGTTQLGDDHERLPGIEGQPSVTGIGVGPWEVCLVTDAGEVHCHRQSLASARGDEGPVYGAPERVEGIDDAVAVTVGAMHACALAADGDVACWGENTHGQLGDGTRETREGPVLATLLRELSTADAEDGS